MRGLQDTDANWLRALADILASSDRVMFADEFAQEVAGRLRQIAGPSALDYVAGTRGALVRDLGNGASEVWCETCHKEHFMPAASLRSDVWRLPCGVVIRPPERVM